MTEKINKRKLQAQQTRDNIYRTSVDLMKRKGLAHVTVEEICKEAGVSVGSFYNYFKSKNDILNEIFKVADDFFTEVIAQELKSGTTHDRIIKYFNFYASYNVARGIDFIKHLYIVQSSMFITKGRGMQNVLADIIREGKATGEIASARSPEDIVRYLFIAVRGVIYDWCLHNGNYDLVAFVDDYVRQMLKALCK